MRLVLTGPSAALHRTGAAPMALSRLDAALLAWLALEGSTSRQRLLRLLWPDQESEAARNALRQRLFRLRRAAGADLVQGSEQLALADGVAADVDDAGGGGELLGGHDYTDCAELQEWLDAQRHRLQLERHARATQHIAA
ncbi:MAG TPA: hypothetical protein VEX14_00655, partial [Burkholderiaceae bacterium]|nr:hypothetical protein [Burkholderiaceae bacterium]